MAALAEAWCCGRLGQEGDIPWRYGDAASLGRQIRRLQAPGDVPRLWPLLPLAATGGTRRGRALMQSEPPSSSREQPRPGESQFLPASAATCPKAGRRCMRERLTACRRFILIGDRRERGRGESSSCLHLEINALAPA